MKCPKCGSRKTVPILHGMPAFDEELDRKLKNREMVLGGCCITGADPQYHCFGCGKDIGTPPILISRRGKEDFREIVTSVEFSYESFCKLPTIISVRKTDEGRIRPKAFSPEGHIQREAATAEWEKLLTTLYCKLYLHEWKKKYENPLLVLDGEDWSLELKLTDGRVRNYRGMNAFPPYWKELKKAFLPFLKGAQSFPDSPSGGTAD